LIGNSLMIRDSMNKVPLEGLASRKNSLNLIILASEISDYITGATIQRWKILHRVRREVLGNGDKKLRLLAQAPWGTGLPMLSPQRALR